MSLLSISDAGIFLERLGVGDLASSEPSLQNLTRLVLAFQENVPFQNISIIATAVQDRHVPSLEEVVAKGLALEGGVCFDLNVFMCMLLRVKGYQADVLDGTYCAAPTRHTHVVLLVHNIRFPGDRHIVDVGTGFPFLEPVAVDELPKTYRWAGLEVKYFQEGDYVYRCHRRGDLREQEKHVMRGEWRQAFDFPLEPVDYDFFRPHMKDVYVNEEENFFLKTVRACRFTKHEKSGTVSDISITDSHHILAAKERNLLIGPMDNLTIQDIREDEWATQLEQNFPNIPTSKINVAINRYMDLEKNKLI